MKTTEDYNQIISDAFNPTRSQKQKDSTLESLLKFKSEVGTRASLYTQLEEAISHLKSEQAANKTKYWWKQPIGIIFLSVVGIIIGKTLWHYIYLHVITSS